MQSISIALSSADARRVLELARLGLGDVLSRIPDIEGGLVIAARHEAALSRLTASIETASPTRQEQVR